MIGRSPKGSPNIYSRHPYDALTAATNLLNKIGIVDLVLTGSTDSNVLYFQLFKSMHNYFIFVNIVERPFWDREAGGSNPLAPTLFIQ